MSCYPYKGINTFMWYFYSFIQQDGWYLWERHHARSWWHSGDQSQPCAVHLELKVQMGKTHTSKKTYQPINANYSKCHQENKPKAVWRMAYAGKWLKMRNVSWIFLSPPQRASHRTSQGQEFPRMSADWQMMMQHNQNNYLAISRIVGQMVSLWQEGSKRGSS